VGIGILYIAVEFYCAAQIFDPVYANTLAVFAEAHCLIDKLPCFHPLNQDKLIHALKLSFISYKTNALEVTQKKVHVLQWHYDLHQHIVVAVDEDRMERNCRYCKSAYSPSDCKCAEQFRMWWEAACLVVLVQPSSAAAEQVFLLLKSF
jgi:hypothetical protein